MRKLPLIPHRGCAPRIQLSAKGIWALVLLLFLASCVSAGLGAIPAHGDIGDLGSPPTEPEIRMALSEFYSGGHPLGSTIDVQFVGPIMIGPPTDHANPPPGPWCVRCGYPDQGISPMYPVKALVTVTIKQRLDSSALSPSSSAETTSTHNGTSCAGISQSQYCPAYYFYRDQRGSWQVA